MKKDFYKTNRDFSCRDIENNCEQIQYKNNSYIRIWCNEQPVTYDSHWHTALEIIMPVENDYDAIINQTPYHICAGEFLLVPPGEMHTLIAPDSGRRFIFQFDITLISKIYGFSSIRSLISKPLHITQTAFPHAYKSLFQLLDQIKEEYFSENEYSELMITSLLLNFFVKLGYHHIHTQNLFPDVQLPKQREYVQKFNDILEYIDMHYTDELTLDIMAVHSGFSKFHFSRLFKQYTNYTFNDYLNFRRIKAAEEMLLDPALSITEIAMQSGFSSISTFNRLFKQMKNCTPSEFRALHFKIIF